MGGLITGLLQGLGQGLSQQHQEGQARHQQEVAREMDLLQKLSTSNHPDIKAIAMTGLIRLASGKEKPQKGFIGKLFGNYEQDPAFQQILSIANQAHAETQPPSQAQPQPSATPPPTSQPPTNPLEGLVSPPATGQGPLVSSFGGGASPSPNMSMAQPVSTPANPAMISPQAAAPQMQAQPLKPPSPVEDDIPTQATKMGFPLDNFGLSSPGRDKAVSSLISGQETDKDRARIDAQTKLLQTRLEALKAEKDAEDRRQSARDATKHGYKLDEIGAQGKNQKDVAAMRIAAKQAISSNGGNPEDYTPEELDALAARFNLGEPVGVAIPTGKEGNKTKVAFGKSLVASGKPRITKDQEKSLTAFDQGSVAVDTIRKRLTELRSKINKGTPVEEEEAIKQYMSSTSAFAAQIGRALNERGAFSERDRKTYQALLSPGLIRTLAVTGEAEKYLDDLKDHMARSKAQAVKSFNENHSLTTPDPIGDSIPVGTVQTSKDGLHKRKKTASGWVVVP